MTVEGLLSINVPVLMYVTSNAKLSINDLVRAKKEAAGILDTISCDINNDGVVDAKDVAAIRKSLLDG